MTFICANCGAISAAVAVHGLDSGTVLTCDACGGETTVLLCKTEDYSVAVEAIKEAGK